jgi:hypothetical protein
MPFTALTTGARLFRIVRNGRTSTPIASISSWFAVVVAPAHLAARDEHITDAGDHECREVRICVHEVDRTTDTQVHRRGERVASLWAVDRAPPDTADALEPQVRGAQVVRHRTCSPR